MAEGELHEQRPLRILLQLLLLLVLLRYVVLKIRFHEMLYNYTIGFRSLF